MGCLVIITTQSLVLAVSCRCFPSQEVLLWAILARACAVYSSSFAVCERVTPACLPSQMVRSFIGISAEGCDPDWYSVQMELRSSLLWGAGSFLVLTSEAHWLASPNSCKMCCLAVMFYTSTKVFTIHQQNLNQIYYSMVL